MRLHPLKLAIAAIMLLGVVSLAGAQSINTNGISNLNQLSQLKSNNANNSALDAASKGRDLTAAEKAQRERLRNIEEHEQGDDQDEALPPAKNVAPQPVNPCPSCALNHPLKTAPGDH